MLDRAETACRQSDVACESEMIETEHLSDDVARTLQRCAEHTGADPGGVGYTHGRRGLKRIVLGSVAERFVRLSQCPVLLARGSDTDDAAEAEQ
jgi:hypothetical protein